MKTVYIIAVFKGMSIALLLVVLGLRPWHLNWWLASLCIAAIDTFGLIQAKLNADNRE